MANLTRLAKKALAARYKKAKKEGYWNDSHIDQGFAEKRVRQARCREQVRNGERSQESCFLISPEIAKASKVNYKL